MGVGSIPICLPVFKTTLVSIDPFTESMSSFTTFHSFPLSDPTSMNKWHHLLQTASFLETNEHNKTTVLADLMNQNQPIGEKERESQ